MRRIQTEELKRIQLEMLKDIHAFCVSNKIKYSVAFGTLLGAVRHEGYIPWDDDIDIMLERPDYSRFVKEYKSKYYEVVDLNNDSNYSLPYAKVFDIRTIMQEETEVPDEYGVYIDVFPIDNLPDEEILQNLLLKKKVRWNYLFNLKRVSIRKDRSFAKNVLLFISHFILYAVSPRSIALKMDMIARLYEKSETDYRGIIVPSDSKKKSIFSKEVFEDTILLKFESAEISAIKKYDAFLTGWYGDYRKLPPEEKRVTHHAYKAYWKDI